VGQVGCRSIYMTNFLHEADQQCIDKMMRDDLGLGGLVYLAIIRRHSLECIPPPKPKKIKMIQDPRSG